MVPTVIAGMLFTVLGALPLRFRNSLAEIISPVASITVRHRGSVPLQAVAHAMRLAAFPIPPQVRGCDSAIHWRVLFVRPDPLRMPHFEMLKIGDIGPELRCTEIAFLAFRDVPAMLPLNRE
jgi:hypothetical protein